MFSLIFRQQKNKKTNKITSRKTRPGTKYSYVGTYSPATPKPAEPLPYILPINAHHFPKPPAVQIPTAETDLFHNQDFSNTNFVRQCQTPASFQHTPSPDTDTTAENCTFVCTFRNPAFVKIPPYGDATPLNAHGPSKTPRFSAVNTPSSKSVFRIAGMVVSAAGFHLTKVIRSPSRRSII